MKRLFLIAVFAVVSFAAGAQNMTFMGVNMHKQFDDFIAAIQEKGISDVFTFEDGDKGMSGKVFGVTPTLFFVHRSTVNGTVWKIELGYSYETRKEASAFYNKVRKTITEQYPSLTPDCDDSFGIFKGYEGDIYISVSSVQAIAGGPGLYGSDDGFVVKVTFEASSKPHLLEFVPYDSEKHLAALVRCQLDTGFLLVSKADQHSVKIPSHIYIGSEMYQVRAIDDYAFINCVDLYSVEIPDSVEVIGKNAFMNCTGLKKVVLPDSLKWLHKGAFMGCEELKKVDFPEGLRGIGDSAFWGCRSLLSVRIPDKVSILDNSTFYNCSGLKEVILPKGLKEIGRMCFKNSATEGGSIVIPEGVEVICVEAFMNTGFTHFEIPASIRRIERRVFAYCRADFHVDEGSQYLSSENGALYDKKMEFLIAYPYNSEADVKIREGVTALAIAAFAGNQRIKSVEFPSSMKKIDVDAFRNCDNLKSVTIPVGVEKIYKGAFEDCDWLRFFILPEPKTLQRVAKNVASKARFYAPDDYVEHYKKSEILMGREVYPLSTYKGPSMLQPLDLAEKLFGEVKVKGSLWKLKLDEAMKLHKGIDENRLILMHIESLGEDFEVVYANMVQNNDLCVALKSEIYCYGNEERVVEYICRALEERYKMVAQDGWKYCRMERKGMTVFVVLQEGRGCVDVYTVEPNGEMYNNLMELYFNNK